MDLLELVDNQRGYYKVYVSFEEAVISLKNTQHRIDLFWKGTLLGEHKSAGESLDKAESQAFNYIQELISGGRQAEVPRYVVLSDFKRIVLYDRLPDRDPGETYAVPYERHEFLLQDFHAHVKRFAFLIGQQTVRFRNEDDANLDAAKLMADLHDVVEAGGYSGQALERLLVRLLFCLFADDTGIFDTNQFELYIRNHTREDGADLGAQLLALFQILNTPEEKRPKSLEEDLAAFPYINGELFAEHLPLAGFNRDMRNRILAAAGFNWGRISPAVFGSLFQGIMDAKERRQVGAHYTSERDILKLIRPLFLDELTTELDGVLQMKQRLQKLDALKAFREKLASLKFLDPACGCGNFLVVAYRELRRLELKALLETRRLQRVGGSGNTLRADQFDELPIGELSKLSKVDVHQFYGIEIEEWPARIAETALWLTDHQMNNELSLAFGNQFMRIPLKASPHIKCANALRFDWNELLPAAECDYVMGNPPFIGHHYQSREQKIDQGSVLKDFTAGGVLDYVCNWYIRACDYINGPEIDCAFVSTNSITQGEQVGILWPYLFHAYGIKIIFAHRPFAWQSEARGKANVHVVIVGFSKRDRMEKRLFDYPHLSSDAVESRVSNINPYLIAGPDIVPTNRNAPLCNVPHMRWGNKATDGGNLIFTAAEKEDFVTRDPGAEQFIRKYYSAEDFIYGMSRFCLWLKDVPPNTLKAHPLVLERVERVKTFREASKAEATRKYASFPTLFRQIAQPASAYILIPRVSSERRRYIPMAFISQEDIAGDVQLIAEASTFHFGILTSEMHMGWVRQTCGRLESRIRYIKDIVYNNFPWPPAPTPDQRAKVEACAQAVLDARQPHLDKGATLADLYDPLTMPPELLKAHQTLDKAVDRCYRKEPFNSERERVEYLFQLYEQLTAPLAITTQKRKPRR